MTNAVMARLGPAIPEKPLHTGLQKRRALFGKFVSLHPVADARHKAGHGVLL
jgi:hypothetical protein